MLAGGVMKRQLFEEMSEHLNAGISLSSKVATLKMEKVLVLSVDPWRRRRSRQSMHNGLYGAIHGTVPIILILYPWLFLTVLYGISGIRAPPQGGGVARRSMGYFRFTVRSTVLGFEKWEHAMHAPRHQREGRWPLLLAQNILPDSWVFSVFSRPQPLWQHACNWKLRWASTDMWVYDLSSSR